MSRYIYRECNPYALLEKHPDQTVSDLHYLGLTSNFYVRWNPDPPAVKPPSWVARVERAKAQIADWNALQRAYTAAQLQLVANAYQRGLRDDDSTGKD